MDTLELIFKKLIDSLTRPESFILLAWVLTEKFSSIKREKEDNAVIDKLLCAQQNRGETLSKLTTMIESMFRTSGR